MRLYLMRHGIAVEGVGFPGGDDARPLTARGRERTRLAARALVRLEGPPDRIWSSPLLRARQTAGIVSETAAADIEIAGFLEPGGDLREAWIRMQAEPVESLLVTGHMPDLSILAAIALTGRDIPFLSFKKAGIAAVEFDGPPGPGRGRLQWLLQPGQLARIAGGK